MSPGKEVMSSWSLRLIADSVLACHAGSTSWLEWQSKVMLPRKTPGHLQPLQNLWDVLDLAQDISEGLHHVWRTHQCLNGILQGSSPIKVCMAVRQAQQWSSLIRNDTEGIRKIWPTPECVEGMSRSV